MQLLKKRIAAAKKFVPPGSQAREILIFRFCTLRGPEPTRRSRSATHHVLESLGLLLQMETAPAGAGQP